MITLADLAVELNVADPQAVLILAHYLRDTDLIDPAGITECYSADLGVAWATQVELSDLAAGAVRDHIHQLRPVLALQQVRITTESW